MGEAGLDLASLFPDWEEFERPSVDLVSEELKIERVELDPKKDGRRVVVGVVVALTHEHPDLEIVILTPGGRVVAETCIVEVRNVRQVLTLHLRHSEPSLTYTVKVGLFLEDELVDAHEAKLTWP